MYTENDVTISTENSPKCLKYPGHRLPQKTMRNVHASKPHLSPVIYWLHELGRSNKKISIPQNMVTNFHGGLKCTLGFITICSARCDLRYIEIHPRTLWLFLGKVTLWLQVTGSTHRHRINVLQGCKMGAVMNDRLDASNIQSCSSFNFKLNKVLSSPT